MDMIKSMMSISVAEISLGDALKTTANISNKIPSKSILKRLNYGLVEKKV